MLALDLVRIVMEDRNNAEEKVELESLRKEFANKQESMCQAANSKQFLVEQLQMKIKQLRQNFKEEKKSADERRRAQELKEMELESLIKKLADQLEIMSQAAKAMDEQHQMKLKQWQKDTEEEHKSYVRQVRELEEVELASLRNELVQELHLMCQAAEAMDKQYQMEIMQLVREIEESNILKVLPTSLQDLQSILNENRKKIDKKIQSLVTRKDSTIVSLEGKYTSAKESAKNMELKFDALERDLGKPQDEGKAEAEKDRGAGKKTKRSSKGRRRQK